MARGNKPRKWSNMKGTLPDHPEQVELTDRVKEILKRKDALAGKSMKELAIEYDALEQEEEFEELTRYERNIEYEAVERSVLEQLEKVREVAGTDLWRGEGQTFSPKYTLSPVVEDPVALMDWVKATKQESLLRLLPSALQSIVTEAMNTEISLALTPAERAALKPGQPGSGQPPPGVTVFLRTSVNHTSGRKKARRSSGPDDAPPIPGPFDEE